MKRDASVWTVLRIRDYRRLWFADVVSDAGSFITFIALAVYVHQLTGTAVAVGFALTLRTIPWFTIGPIAGTFADRLDRRVIMVSCDLIRAGLVVLLPFTQTAGQAYAIAFASGLFGPFFRPARAALIPSTVPADRYVHALAVAEVSHNVMHMIGPALGGVAVLLVGARHAFFLDAGTFVFSAVMVLGVSIRGSVRGRPAGVADVWRDLKEGARNLWRDRILRSAVPAFALLLLGFEGAIGALVVYVQDRLGRGGGSYGIVLAAAGLGTAVATLLLARRPRAAPRTWPLVAAAASPAVLVLVALRPGFEALLAIMFLGGVITSGTLYVDTFIAERTPDEGRGRAFSLNGAMLTMGEAIGTLGVAALADHIGPARAIAIGGLGGAGLALLALVPALSALRAADAERAASGAPSDVPHPVPDAGA